MTGRDASRDERGASLIEYALLVALIALVCLLAVTFFGGRLSTSFSTSASSVQAG
jgi:pilus assembly protein Flp/PilA